MNFVNTLSLRHWARCAAWCAMCLLPVAAAATEPAMAGLDTLLYTPAQRQEIGRARLPQSGSDNTLLSTHLQGVVRRGNGKGTVWINGKALPQGAADTPRIQGVDAIVNGKQLRVGESIDPLSGTRTDVVEPGAVTQRAIK
jgi:hypothetical protein